MDLFVGEDFTWIFHQVGEEDCFFFGEFDAFAANVGESVVWFEFEGVYLEFGISGWVWLGGGDPAEEGADSGEEFPEFKGFD